MVFQKFKVMVDTVCTLNRKIRLRDGCISGLAWRPTSILSLERTWLGPMQKRVQWKSMKMPIRTKLVGFMISDFMKDSLCSSTHF